MDTFSFEAEGGRRSRAKRWLGPAALGTVILLVAATMGTAFAAYRSERARSQLILPGVVVQGVAVGGMTRAQALGAVSAAVERVLSRRIIVQAGGGTWTASARALGLQADVSAAVDAAVMYSRERSTVSRLLSRLRGEGYPLLVGVRFSILEDLKIRFLDEVKRAVARSPRDAQLRLEDGALVRVRALRGAALARADSEQKLDHELLSGSTASLTGRAASLAGSAASVRLPVRVIPPKVGGRSFGRTIAVDLSSNHLFLYDGLQVIRTYPIATAMPGFRTPPGEWTIVDKRRFPTWYNPAPNGWAANEPLVVPPGPENPMGTRALYLDAPGLIRIHGTNTPSSIGHYASHGCIRLFIPSIEELYELVSVGTHVLIYGAPPWGIPSSFGIPGA